MSDIDRPVISLSRRDLLLMGAGAAAAWLLKSSQAPTEPAKTEISVLVPTPEPTIAPAQTPAGERIVTIAMPADPVRAAADRIEKQYGVGIAPNAPSSSWDFMKLERLGDILAMFPAHMLAATSLGKIEFSLASGQGLLQTTHDPRIFLDGLNGALMRTEVKPDIQQIGEGLVYLNLHTAKVGNQMGTLALNAKVEEILGLNPEQTRRQVITALSPYVLKHSPETNQELDKLPQGEKLLVDFWTDMNWKAFYPERRGGNVGFEDFLAVVGGRYYPFGFLETYPPLERAFGARKAFDLVKLIRDSVYRGKEYNQRPLTEVV